MRLISHADYALRTLICPGVAGNYLTPIGKIAAVYRISKNYLLKVARHLAAGG